MRLRLPAVLGAALAALVLLVAGCAHDPGPFGEVKPLPHPIQADEGPPIDRRDR